MASIVGTKGVDISYAQGNINMSKVKEAGYGWAMIRVGQSTRIIDVISCNFTKPISTLNVYLIPHRAFIYFDGYIGDGMIFNSSIIL